jgi:sec-independent protein translocase protein TatA
VHPAFFHFFPTPFIFNHRMNSSLAFIEGIGGPELMMIMFVVLLLFGANKLPELAKGIGKSVRTFKKAASGVEEEVRRAMQETEESPPKKFPPYAPPPPAPTMTLPPGEADKPTLPPPTAD